MVCIRVAHILPQVQIKYNIWSDRLTAHQCDSCLNSDTEQRDNSRGKCGKKDQCAYSIALMTTALVCSIYDRIKYTNNRTSTKKKKMQ